MSTLQLTISKVKPKLLRRCSATGGKARIPTNCHLRVPSSAVTWSDLYTRDSFTTTMSKQSGKSRYVPL